MTTSTRCGSDVVRSGLLSTAAVFLALTCLSSAQPLTLQPLTSTTEPVYSMPLPPLPPLALPPPLVPAPPSSISLPIPPVPPPTIGPVDGPCPCPEMDSTTTVLPLDCTMGRSCQEGGIGQRARFLERSQVGPRLWGSAEFLLWRVKGYGAPPLVTTGP